MKKNDDKIIKLKEQIAKKKEGLKGSSRFTPITNCNLVLDGSDQRVNLHTLNDANKITDVMVRLNVLKMSADDLGVTDTYMVGGYLLTEWLTDLKLKLKILDRKAEEKKLKAMEAKLTKLLSLEKQTELEIAEIENML
jgi:hypothetical protein